MGYRVHERAPSGGDVGEGLLPRPCRHLQLTKALFKARPADVLLGPWCRTPRVRGLPVLTEGATPADFVAAAAAFPYVFDRVIEALARIFNTTFGISRSTRYWALVTHPLLYHYLLGHLVKWHLVQRALDGRMSDYEVTYAVPGPESTPLLYPHLRTAYEEDDRFNLESFSVICRGVGVPGVLGSPGARVARRSGLLGSGRRKLQALYAYAVARRRHWLRPRTQEIGPGTIVVKDMAPAFVQELAATSGLRFVDLDEVAALRPALRLAPDEALRRRAAWTHEDPLIASILEGLQFHLPVQQVECFPHVYEATSRTLGRRGVPDTLVFGILERLEYRLIAAEAMSRGARLVSIQHGGNYGESIAAVSLVVERTFSDRFVTYGWQEDAERDVAAGGFRTTSLAPGPPPTEDGHVLLVAPFFHEYPHHLNWLPEHRYRKKQAFLHPLPAGIRHCLVVRMRPGRTTSARLEREWLPRFPATSPGAGRCRGRWWRWADTSSVCPPPPGIGTERHAGESPAPHENAHSSRYLRDDKIPTSETLLRRAKRLHPQRSWSSGAASRRAERSAPSGSTILPGRCA